MGKGSLRPGSALISYPAIFDPSGGAKTRQRRGRGATRGPERRPRGRQDCPRALQESPRPHKS
eukprot:822135-Pyramimonas_sp.AAC.1